MSFAVRFFFVTATLWIYLFTPGYGYTAASGILPRVASLFSHAGWLHWALNAWGFCSLFASVARVVAPLRLLALACLAAFAATYVAEYDLPTVGASGILFFLVGCDAVLRWGGLYFKIDPVSMSFYTATILLALAVPAFVPGVNWKLHLAACVEGIIYGVYELRCNHNRKRTAQSRGKQAL